MLAAEMSEASSRQRTWAALFVGGVFALPLLFSSYGEGAGRSRADERGDEAPRRLGAGALPAASGRWLAVHVGLTLFLCGFAPVLCHYGLATWNAARLGAWTSYGWMGCVGGFVLLEAVPPDRLWLVAVVMGVMFLSLCALALQVLVLTANFVAAAGVVTAGTAAMLGLWTIIALLNARCAYGVLAPVVCHGSGATPAGDICTYRAIYRYGALDSLGCGLAALLCFVGPLYVQDPDYATQHPGSMGVAVTGVVWSLFGLFGPPLGPAVGTWLLRGDSNERTLCASSAVDDWALATWAATLERVGGSKAGWGGTQGAQHV